MATWTSDELSTIGSAENLGAAAVELTPADLREMESAASQIPVHGARYPAELERRTGR